MRLLALLLLASAAWPASLLVRGARVFDPLSGRFSGPEDVTVRGERIEAVGAKLRPRGARVVDGRGKFLIPGLIDAHVHLVHVLDFNAVTGDEVLPLFLYHGVTSVRDTGDHVAAEKLVERYAAAHPLEAPRVFLCSYLIDGDPPYHRDIGWALTDEAKVPTFVAEMKAWGARTLKIYVGVERNIGRRVIEEGHKHGLTVTAHLGKYTAQDAIADGLDCLEHIWSIFNYLLPPHGSSAAERLAARAGADFTSAKARALIAQAAAKPVFVDPTLAVFRNMLLLSDVPEYNAHPDVAQVPKRLRDNWDGYRRRSALAPETRDLRRKEFQKYQELTGLLHRAGVPLLAGTDAPEPYVPPGGSLHQELEMLVESGLSPAAALRAATYENARSVKMEAELGTIAAGKLADMVLLDSNPLDDIRNTRNIRTVIKGGRVIRRENLLQSVPKL